MDMLRRVLAGILVVVFLVSVAVSVNVHFGIVSVRSDNGGMATGDVPIGVQMDRAPGDVPRAQVSSPLVPTQLRVEIAPVPAERLAAPTVIFESAVAIIKQQHVFRI
jgi:hypothetical protein